MTVSIDNLKGRSNSIPKKRPRKILQVLIYDVEFIYTKSAVLLLNIRLYMLEIEWVDLLWGVDFYPAHEDWIERRFIYTHNMIIVYIHERHFRKDIIQKKISSYWCTHMRTRVFNFILCRIITHCCGIQISNVKWYTNFTIFYPCNITTFFVIFAKRFLGTIHFLHSIKTAHVPKRGSPSLKS